MFYYDPYYFFKLLDAEIHSVQWKARRQRMSLSVRLNGTSDIPYETYLDSSGLNVFQRHPDIQFLDYTKIEDRMALQIPNYTLVYSVSERSDPAVVASMLDSGARVATVFSTKRGDQLPKRHSFAGKSYRVVDGDTHDLLHLRPKGSVLGLRYKMAFSERTRKALKPNKRFVILQEVA
jgi:hypothetical protein